MHINLKIARFLDKAEVIKYGISNISKIKPWGKKYKSAITLMLNIKPGIKKHDGVMMDRVFHSYSLKMRNITDEFSAFLTNNKVQNKVIHFKQNLRLMTPFSHKKAAVLSGLGWIGKNALLVTPEFGPRVRLATVLVGAKLPAGKPVTKSKCGDCEICVVSCPVKAIKGKNWKPGMPRHELLDSKRCKQMMIRKEKKLKNDYACAICWFVCPHGAK